MKNIKIFIRVIMCVLFAAFILFVLNSCEQTTEEEHPTQTESAVIEPDITEAAGVSLSEPALEPEKPEQIRVFENGNVNIRLFPDGTFIANLFHNSRITGTYTEMTQGDETAVLFTHNGITTAESGAVSFETPGRVTVVGGIAGGVLTMPEDWDDGHGHSRDFMYQAYPMVFAGSDNQEIILYADNTFAANFAGDIKILGFYAIRRTNITFALGSPGFSNSGVPTGIFLLAELITGGDGGREYDEDDYEHGHDEESALILELPGIWAEAAGESTFTLQE